VIIRADGPIEVLLHQPKERQPKESQAVVPSAEEVSSRRSRGRQEWWSARSARTRAWRPARRVREAGLR